MTRFRKLLNFFALATFAVWFGGFTFYVSIVVPIGTDILGSARAQGEITQQVTHWLNLFSAMALAAMMLDGFAWPKDGWRWIRFASILAMALCLLVLIWLHPQLDDLIDGTRRKIRVTDREAFYATHRLYLWASTLQWAAGWVWLLAFVVPSNQDRTAETNS